MADSNSAQVVHQWLDALNNHDADAMRSLCAADVLVEEVAEGSPVRGAAQLEANYIELFEGYPDCSVKVLNRVADDRGVAVEVGFQGTNKGPFRGTPATGREINLRIAYFFRVQDGKITQITEYYDMASLLEQLGLAPAE